MYGNKEKIILNLFFNYSEKNFKNLNNINNKAFERGILSNLVHTIFTDKG